ncbi:DUF6010 family protein [Methylocapsa aurea]|uniref:DUF6010 family protein n=1 Tax=Methylocapsa aurea TaxID=663610 RepID=UPI00069081B3|nr:DUF6010 family protein [Methylocapsa aurea]
MGGALVANSFARSPAMIGGLASVATIPAHFFLSKLQSEQFACVLLAAIGAIYVGFALQRGSLSQIATEIAAAFGFLAAALAGLWLNVWIVPIAYVLHGAWDYAHHQGSKLVTIPVWYPPFCAIYDFVAALGLAAMWTLRG